MTDQPTLFDIPKPEPHDCVRNGPCRTCGATRPADYTGGMFLEPVSLECGDCNFKTLREMYEAPADVAKAAAERHYRGMSARKKR